MKYTINTSGDPTFQIVTRAEAKAHLRLATEFTDEDTMIDSLIKAATGMAESFTDRAIRRQKFIFKIKRFPCGRDPVPLPKGNFIELNTLADPVGYYDASNDLQTLEDTDLMPVDQCDSAALLPAAGDAWPSVSTDYLFPVTVTYSAGYADAASVPQEIKQAVLLQVAALYEFRENLTEGGAGKIAVGFEDLLKPFILGDEFTEYGVEADGSC